MSTEYTWATNKLKLARAVAESFDKSEEGIKARYIEIGGALVITNQNIMSDEEIVKGAEDSVEVENTESISEDVESEKVAETSNEEESVSSEEESTDQADVESETVEENTESIDDSSL